MSPDLVTQNLDQVKNEEMSPKIAPGGGFYDANYFKKNFPDGRIGSDPSLANIAHGEKIFHAAVKYILEDIQGFVGK